MGFVNKEYIFLGSTAFKESLQPCMGVKEVVVIAYDAVCKKCGIQGKFKGTDPVFFGIFKDPFPGKGCTFGYKGIEGVVDPVKMSPGISAAYGITVCFFKETYLLLRSKGHGLEPESPGAKYLKSLFGSGPCYGLGGKVEDAVTESFTHCLYRGEQHG